MSKKLTDKEMETVNPNSFTYKEGQKVEIDANLFEATIQAFRALTDKERKVYFEEVVTEEGISDIEKTMNNKEPKIFLTDEGRYFMGLHLDFLSLHFENIKQGKAISKEGNTMKKVE